MDHRQIALRSFKRACDIFRMDLEALPDEGFIKTFGGTSRSVADIVHEVNELNDEIGMTLRGETPPETVDEGWTKAPPEMNSKEKVIAAFNESSGALLKQFESYSPEQLDEQIQHGERQTDRLERCRFAALHLWYHSGQLNYIQTLLGDDGWHWS